MLKQKCFCTPRLLAVVAVTAALLSGCQTHTAKTTTVPIVTTATAAKLPSSVMEKVLGEGLYEMVLFPSINRLYVASAQSFKQDNGGVLYKVDPETLTVVGTTHTDLKNFGMVSQPGKDFFYTTNSVDGTVSKIDVTSGKVLQRLTLSKKNDKGEIDGAREMLWVGNELYIGAVANPGYISVVDTQSFRLKTRITHAGKWVTGLLYSPSTQRIYAGNGSGEIMVINPKTHHIEQRWTSGESKPNLFLNFAEDPHTHRLFVTDNSEGKATYVFDEQTGKVIKKIPGDSLSIKFNAQRNELYISQRESRQVLSLDTTTYAVKQRWHFAGSPNSLLLTDDGKTLYVTVKQDFNSDFSSKGPDSLVRIRLETNK
ncbi:YncE family protein [Rosenbergiella australiborealis]|uniref:YncE family protein n=1 Tax=Rosenbergiella australiborealis TaxID=1544696 RepID=UPI001F4EB45B|nr:hypothetical protein [Rosenbergiella australiborealis]